MTANIPRCDLEESRGKLPVQEVPASLVKAAARALQDGNRRRPPLSWRNRPTTMRYYGSLQRHLLAWVEGREMDSRSALSHLDHAAANLAILLEIEAGGCHEPTDDRPCKLSYHGSEEEETEDKAGVMSEPVDDWSLLLAREMAAHASGSEASTREDLERDFRKMLLRGSL